MNIRKATWMAAWVAMVLATAACTDQYTVTLSVDDPAHGYCTGAGTFDAGTKVTISANSNEGFIFDHWEGDSTFKTNNFLFTLEKDVNYVAFYRQTKVVVDTAGADTSSTHTGPEIDTTRTFRIDVRSNVGSTEGSGSYRGGTTATVKMRTISPDYEFREWICTTPQGQPLYVVSASEVTGEKMEHTFVVQRDAVYTAYLVHKPEE